MSVLNFNTFFSYIKIVFKIWVILAGMILNQEAMICPVLLCKSTDACIISTGNTLLFMFRILWRFWKLFWMFGQLRLLFVQIHVENRWRHRNLWIHWKRRRTWLLRRRSKCCVSIGIIIYLELYLLKGCELYETIAVMCNHHFRWPLRSVDMFEWHSSIDLSVQFKFALKCCSVNFPNNVQPLTFVILS